VTISELRTLERLFTEVQGLRNRMDDRFDAQDERLRRVEDFVTASSARAAEKKISDDAIEHHREESEITKRWVIKTLIGFATVIIGGMTIVIKVLEHLHIW